MERYKVEITPDADRDMDGIFAYISEKLHAPVAAHGLIERMYAELDALKTMPARYPLSRDAFLARQGFRLLVVDHYIAFYVVDKAGHRVIVHRVIYGKRDYSRLF